MTIRAIVLLAVIPVLMTAACAQPTEPGHVETASAKTRVEPFAEFLKDVSAARYRDYAGKPGTRVRSEAAFNEMRGYLLTRYRDADVRQSYDADGVVFDCLVTQAATASPGKPASNPSSAATAGPAAGQQAACPEGSVPVRRVTMAELARWPTLQQFLGKSPGGEGNLPPAPPPSRQASAGS